MEVVTGELNKNIFGGVVRMKLAQERLGTVFAVEQLLHEFAGPSVKNLLVATSHDSMTLD